MRSQRPSSRPCRRRHPRRRATRPPRVRRSTRRRAPPRDRPHPIRAARRPRPSGSRASRGSGGRERRRWRSFNGLLGKVVVAVLLLERQRAPIFAVFVREPLRLLDTPTESLRRASKLELGIDVQLARDVHCREEHVAQLVRRMILLQLAHLVLEICERALDVGVLEAARLRAVLDLLREEQRGSVSGTSWKTPTR